MQLSLARIVLLQMKKFQAIIQFSIRDDFSDLIAPHRVYINYLINKNIVDQYVVSLEKQTVWVTINAADRAAVEKYLDQAPLAKYWTYEVTELRVWDGQIYRLPVLQLN
jgi:hypothetical protein